MVVRSKAKCIAGAHDLRAWRGADCAAWGRDTRPQDHAAAVNCTYVIKLSSYLILNS